MRVLVLVGAIFSFVGCGPGGRDPQIPVGLTIEIRDSEPDLWIEGEAEPAGTLSAEAHRAINRIHPGAAVAIVADTDVSFGRIASVLRELSEHRRLVVRFSARSERRPPTPVIYTLPASGIALMTDLL